MSNDAEFLIIRKALQQTLRELPPLPTAVAKVMQEMQKAEPNASAIEKIISGDQALSSKVLRVVNSAYYGLSRQVTNVGQAIIILGLQQIRNITLSVGSLAAFNVRSAKQHQMMARFWQHSFGAASTCNILAGSLGWERKQVETLFTCGILHDIGRLFLYVNFTNTYERLIQSAVRTGNTVEALEISMLAISHAEIGAMIAEKWALPTQLVEVIRDHEGPFGEEFDPMTAIIHFSDWLNKGVYFDEEKIPSQGLDPQVAAFLGLSPEALTQIQERTRNKVAEASEMFGMVA